jgi:ribosomal protein L24
MHVKKGDKVQVISGKDKGKQGVILAAFPKKNRVIVEGVNIIKKPRNHLKQIRKAALSQKRHRFTYQK